MIGAYGVPEEGPRGRSPLAPTASGAGRAAHGSAGPQGKSLRWHWAAFSLRVFDRLSLISCSPSVAQWEFSAFRSLLFNSKCLWVLDSPGLNLYVCLKGGSPGVGDATTTPPVPQPESLPRGEARLSLVKAYQQDTRQKYKQAQAEKQPLGRQEFRGKPAVLG